MPVKKQGFATRSNKWWMAAPIALALAVCALMFRGGGSMYWGPLESDLTNQFYPWRVFLHRWWLRGVFAFWDPHIFSGYPTVETQQMLNLNPLHLATIWLDPKVGLTFFTAINTLIGCVGMAWGLRRWGRCSWMAAALGAGLYVFGALFAVRVMAGHITVVSAMAWWPLAALSTLRIARWMPATVTMAGDKTPLEWETSAAKKGARRIWESMSLRRLIAISIAAHAMVCLAGAPQYIVYLFYIDLAVLLAAARRWTWGVSLMTLAGVWVMALVVSAPQWLPALWYLPYTGRALTSNGATGFTLSGMQNILFEMLLPFPFGDDITRGHLHFKNVWETATYPGGLALILSLTLILRAGVWTLARVLGRTGAAAPITPLAAAGSMIFLLGCYMMVGGWLPGFGGFREPQKARALLAFGFAVMSAGAFDGIARRFTKWRVSMWIAVLVVGYLLIRVDAYSDPATFRDLIRSFGFPFDPLAGEYYNSVIENPSKAALDYYLALQWGTVGVLAAILFLSVGRRNLSMAAAMLLMVALADPFLAHAPAWLARHSWARAGLPEPVRDYFEPKLKASAGELPWRVILHASIINRTHHMDGLYEFHGYDPLMPAFGVGRMLVKGVNETTGEQRGGLRPHLLRRVGVRYDSSAWLGGTVYERGRTEPDVLVSTGTTLFAITRNVVAGSPGWNIFGPDLNGTHYVLPGQMVMSDPGIGKSPEEISAAVPAEFREEMAGLFNGGEGSEAAQLTSASRLLAGETMVAIATGRPDEFGVKISLTAPGLIVYKGTWLPGWQVVVDGVDTGHALFTNNWMSGAVVPVGEHDVVFRYRPVAWWPSIVISGLGLLVVAGMMIGARKQGK